MYFYYNPPLAYYFTAGSVLFYGREGRIDQEELLGRPREGGVGPAIE